MQLHLETTGPTREPTHLALHQDWISAKDEESGVEANVSCGAGLGNGSLRIRVQFPDGTHAYDQADIREMVEDWVNRIVAEHENDRIPSGYAKPEATDGEA